MSAFALIHGKAVGLAAEQTALPRIDTNVHGSITTMEWAWDRAVPMSRDHRSVSVFAVIRGEAVALAVEQTALPRIDTNVHG